MTFYNYLELIVASAAVIGVFVWGLAGKSKQSSNEAIMMENTSLRNQLGDKTSEYEVMKTRAEKSEKNEQYLKDLAQSKPDFSKLLETNNKLSVQLTTQHKELLDSFNKLAVSVTTLAKSIARGNKKHG